jgi:ankyrin repeat protein
MKRQMTLFLFLCASASPVQAYSPIPIPDINYTELHEAADQCDPEKAKAALSEMPAGEKTAAINRIDREGYTPLAYAAQQGCLEIVKLLVESGAAVDASEEYSHWTPLLRASQNRHADVVRYLLASGADVNVRASLGQTPWTEAVRGPFFNRGPEGDRDATLQALREGGALDFTKDPK